MSCIPNNCKDGNYYTAFESIMKSLSLPFGRNNEMISCCVFKEEN